MTDESLLIRDFLEEIRQECEHFRQPFGVLELLFCIRDIPYGRPMQPRSAGAALAEWKGTCSGKHLLAQSALHALGYASRLYCIPYRIDDASRALPPEVIDQYISRGIWDVHNCLELESPTRPILVDVTWPRDLKEFGFLTTVKWDGITDFAIAAPAGHLIPLEPGEDLNLAKQEILTRLNRGDAVQQRERYIADLSAYAERHSKYPTRERGIRSTLAAIREDASLLRNA